MREGCTACHNPHGSVNPELLTVRDSNLCLRCHAQTAGRGAAGGIYIGNVNHTGFFLHYGTCWTAGCHTAVHGSNIQPFLLLLNGTNQKLGRGEPARKGKAFNHAIVPRAPNFVFAAVLLLFHAVQPATAQTSESNLPPAATVDVDFARDIELIPATSCLRCHGPEKPKSHFRLDNRPDALKGGDNGVDILPGATVSDSPLIRYVAQLVPDLEMLPVDKGDALAPAQISLVRAWIEQGAKWSTNAESGLINYNFSPVIGGTAVHGNAAEFREQNWEKNGANGGLAEFDLAEKLDPETKL